MNVKYSTVSLLVVNSVFLGLAAIAVGLRFYSIHLTARSRHLSDYLIIGGLIATTALVGLGYGMVFAGGAGKHMKDTLPEEFSMLMKIFAGASTMWALSASLIKLSILAFYHKVFVMRKFRYVLYAECALIGGILMFSVIVPFVLCTPFNYTWNKSIEGHCMPFMSFYLPVAAVNTFVDLSIFCLPLPILWKLNMAKEKKMALSAVFLLGLIVCIISLLRIEALYSLKEDDFPYTVVPDANYAALEVELATVNACLPFYRPLLGRLFPNSRLGTKKTGVQWTGRRTRFNATQNMSFDPFPFDTTCSRAYPGEPGRQSSEDITAARPHGNSEDKERIFVNQSIDVYYSPR